MKNWRMTVVVVVVAGLAGCARYEYDVIKPVISPGRVGEKDDVVIDGEVVRYRIRTVDGRLVVRVFNSGTENVELVGVRSTVVDPTGQSRAIRSQLIPPGAFAKLILPPVRPEFVSDGGVRLGTSSGGDGGGYGPGAGQGEFGYGVEPDRPREFRLRDGGEVYWDWKGETEARVILLLKVGGREVGQELIFGRRRVQ